MSNIPIIINNLNRLSTTKKLVEDLMKLGYNNIHILDNNSTYPPLLYWYNDLQLEGKVTVKLFDKNYGQLALWNSGYIAKFKDELRIVYTDSDIELNAGSKEGFIEELVEYSIQMQSKVGLALQIDDLPETELGDRVRKHEAQFWEKRRGITRTYKAYIDTTFAVIDPNKPFTYEALRVAGDFTARHMPWYTDWSNMTEEEKYVLEHLDNKHSTYKGYYLQWLEKNGKVN